MTQTASNPPRPDAPAPPSKALRLARLVIASALLVAVVFFMIYMVNDIQKNLAQQQSPVAQPAYPDLLPGDLARQQDHPLLALAQLSQGQYIDHHPGHLPPFAGAAAYGVPPYREPISEDGYVMEHARYRIPNQSPQNAFEHYDREATRLGMKLVLRPQRLDKPEEDLLARWVKGDSVLNLTVTPLIGDVPDVQPPLKADPPLSVVVQYSYPAPRSN